jgi:hypothetical protein
MANILVVTSTSAGSEETREHPNTGSPSYNVDHSSLTSPVADGASAVAFNLDTANSLSTEGAKLLRLKNSGTQKFGVDKDGRLIIVDSGSLPTASSTYEGYLAMAYDSTRKRDRFYVCVRYVLPDTTTIYKWKEISLDWLDDCAYYVETFSAFVSLADTALVANRVYFSPVFVGGTMNANRLLFELYNSDAVNSHQGNWGIYRETSTYSLAVVLKGAYSLTRQVRAGYLDIGNLYIEKGQYYIALVGDNAALKARMATIGLTSGTHRAAWWYCDQVDSTLADGYSLNPPTYLDAAPWCGLITKA